jgi:multidrug resistance protein, MATE family
MAAEHAFTRTPHRTLLLLSIPATLSLIAEPITGMVDTAFIARLGAAPLAALGIGATALSTLLWAFSFLGISAQTEVAQAAGHHDLARARAMTSLALLLATFFSLLLLIIFIPGAPLLTSLLGAAEEVQATAVIYTRLRLLGAPAILITMIGFGVLRGMQNMRAPLYVAVGVNMLNILLDGPLIFGLGPIPALGAAGAALASTFSQYVGAIWVLRMVIRRVGFEPHIHWPDVWALLRVGGDLFLRTGLLTFFLLLSTRIANQIGAEAGAAHQAVRTVWFFLALVMEGFAMTAQSLVGYFLGARQLLTARQAAILALRWSLGIGVALTGLMLVGSPLVIALFVPENAVSLFPAAWTVAAFVQPLAALAFATDGILWGAGDYPYMRNGMLIATTVGVAALALIRLDMPQAFTWIWVAMAVWVGVRAIWGTLRVWPGVGRSPLRVTQTQSELQSPASP